ARPADIRRRSEPAQCYALRISQRAGASWPERNDRGHGLLPQRARAGLSRRRKNTFNTGPRNAGPCRGRKRKQTAMIRRLIIMLLFAATGANAQTLSLAGKWQYRLDP